MDVCLDYAPTKKQMDFHRCDVDEVLFGGAAGGGKSVAIVMDAIDRCLRNPCVVAYLFRRTYRELNDTLIFFARRMIPESIGIYKATEHEFLFVNGSIMRFRHLQSAEDKFKYQGAEINLLYIDELTHFKKDEYDFLKSRLRANKELGIKPLVRLTSNPGGRGHSWVKAYFVDVAPIGTVFRTEVVSSVLNVTKEYSRAYIPAKVTDNPHIGEDYIFELEQKPKALRDALLHGKWDAFDGQVFCEWVNDHEHYEDRLFSHVVAPFAIPDHWPKYRSFDFGYSRPFSVLWWAVGEDDEVYLYREWYGASAPNVGIKLSAKEMAIGILKREEQEKISLGYADPSIWDGSRGESVARQMENVGVYFVPGENARLAGKMMFHERLKFDDEGKCGMMIFNTCREFIRTIPALEYDVHHPEDINSDGEDHIYDAARYFLMNKYKGRRNELKVINRFDPLDDKKKPRREFLQM